MRTLFGSALAGVSATLLMEYASNWLYGRQSEETRTREEQLRDGAMPTATLVRKAARMLGTDIGDDRAPAGSER